MPYDEDLAKRVRAAIGAEYNEIKMFGGLCFTVNTHMAVGVIRDEVMLRLPKETIDDAISRGAQQMMMGERVMTGMVSVSGDEIATDEDLASWMAPSVAYTQSLPPKASKKK